MSAGEGVEGGGAGQATAFKNRVRDAVDAYNDLQQLGTAIMDAADGTPDEMLIGFFKASGEIFSNKLKGGKQTTVIGNHRPDIGSIMGDKPYYEAWKKLGHNIIDMPKDKYSPRANIRWLTMAMKRGDDIYVGTASGVPSGKAFGMEMDFLLKSGYKRVDDYMKRQ